MINIEWGNFWCDDLLNHFALDADRVIDAKSPNQGSQYLEKMTSGLYLGEISRLLMLDILEELSLSDSIHSEEWSFSTTLMSQIDDPWIRQEERLLAQKTMLEKVFGVHDNIMSRKASSIVLIAKHVCCLVRMRAAILLGTVLSAVLRVAVPLDCKNTDKEKNRRIAVGVDGE